MRNKNNTSVTFDEWVKLQEEDGNLIKGPYTGPRPDINKIKPEVHTGPTVRSKKKKGKK